ncbi:polysaccharide pyruvyl transferase family protein [Luteimonas sp. BDR2-5]|uniref:polysaccharide pyruvyl transferase family protein n=1 Tax=Proluteimonas luteida TaxID=2878685 RepID=UPI001E485EAE|nr:polysaccharide pyruvyl transferase family protein [Luteimonas sp. BDR2-5]MCD9029522.1 polysaccharide pyruvyl transferase family protein [Luteimonas sp. BDR2-5]
MHRILNYGSFLQGYGLKQVLRSLDPDARIGFLDYRPGPPLVESKEGNVRGFARVAKKLSEYSKVDAKVLDKIRFFNHKRTYARRYFPMLGLTPEPNYDRRIDLQIIGSDEVFNCVQANANVGYSRDLFGHASPARKLISYAGSFGNTTIEKIRKYGLEAELAADFARFDDISVRDENSRGIVRELIGVDPALNVDPVLAYDFMRDCHDIPKEMLIEKPYLIVYAYPGRISEKESAHIRRYARENGLLVVCLGGIQSCCDIFIDCSPFEVLALFRDAAGIITDTFHGSIFSIINEKIFITLIRKSHGDGYGNEEKLGYLLDYLKLTGQGTFDLSHDAIEQRLAGSIDYGETRRILGEARSFARSYLERNLVNVRKLA